MSAALALVRREEAYVDGKVLCVHDLEHAKSFEHAVVEFFMQLFDSVLYRKQSAIRFLSRSATGRGGAVRPGLQRARRPCSAALWKDQKARKSDDGDEENS